MARALRQRIGRQNRLESPDRLVVAPESQRGLNPVEGGRPPQLLQASHLGADELLVAELSERRAVPQLQRSVEQVRRLRGHLVHASARGMHQPVEADGVNRAGVHLEQVAGHASENPDRVGGTGRPDCGTQPRDQVVHRALGIGRQVRTPQHVAQPIDRHHLPGVRQEHGEQPADPRPPVQGGLAARGVELHGAEHPNPSCHAASVPAGAPESGWSQRIASRGETAALDQAAATAARVIRCR